MRPTGGKPDRFVGAAKRRPVVDAMLKRKAWMM